MLSKPKRLSYWEQMYLIEEPDIVIIGAGIVGLLTGYELKMKSPQKRIVVLEANHIGAGATTKNAGFACIGSIGEIIADAETYGEQATIELISQRAQGLKRLLDIASPSEIGYQPANGCELFESEELFEQCNGRVGYWNKLLQDITGLPNTFSIGDAVGFSNIHTKSIINNEEGLINTGRLYQRLLSITGLIGVRIINGLIVDSFHDYGKCIEVVSSHLPRPIRAKQLVICTNAFTKQLIPDLDLEPCRNQVLVTSGVDNRHISCGFHIDKGYTYLRSIDDRVLIGGGRNHFSKEYDQLQYGQNQENIDYLISILRSKVLPDQHFDIDYKWSGILTGGNHRLPIVRKHGDNIVIGVKLGGMGIALGSNIALETAQLAMD